MQIQGAGYSPQELDFTSSPVQRKKASKKVLSLEDESEPVRRQDALAVLKKSGQSSRMLRDAGYSLVELKAVGFSVTELMEDAGFELSEIQMAGFPPDSLPNGALSLARQKSLRAAVTPPAGSPLAKSNTESSISSPLAKPQTEKLVAILEPVKTVVISGPGSDGRHNVAAFTNPFVAEEDEAKATAARRLDALVKLKDANQHAGVLRAAGYALDELKAVGFEVEELTGDANFLLAEIKDAGFPAVDCKAAGFTIKELRKIGYTVHELSQCGYSRRELEFAASVTPAKRQTTLRTTAVQKLRRAGQNAGMTRLSGYSLLEMKTAGYTVLELVTDGGYSIAELKATGFTAGECKASGMYSWMDLKLLGYTLDEMKAGGASVRDMIEIDFTASRLYKAGYTCIDMRKAQFSAAQLRGAGYTLPELVVANFPGTELCQAGFTVAELKTQNYSLAMLRRAGVPASVMMLEGHTLAELKHAGYTPSQLVGSGAGFSLKDVRAAGFTDEELVVAGYRMKEIIGDDGSAEFILRQNSRKVVPIEDQGPKPVGNSGFIPAPIKKMPSGALTGADARPGTSHGLMSKLGSLFTKKS